MPHEGNALKVRVITGSRERLRDPKRLAELERVITGADLVLHGGAPGVDEQAGEIAFSLSIHCMVVQALWRRRGRKAGPERNTVLAEIAAVFKRGGAEGVFGGFPASDSVGTWDCVRKLTAAGIEGDTY